MVVNNWFVIMNGVTAVSYKYAPLYFIAFWLITVMIVMNLVVAYVLEAFFEKTKENDARAAASRSQHGSAQGGEEHGGGSDGARNSRAAAGQSGMAALDALLGDEGAARSPFSFGI